MNIPFPEIFLHHIWKQKLFNFNNLQTTEGETLELLDVGQHNHHAGPDFGHARIRIGATLWAGSVEIHKKSSDWLLHKHQLDKAYNNTILHVVYEDDKIIHTEAGAVLPTLILKDRIPISYIKRYWTLLNNDYWIPCESQLPRMLDDTARLYLWLDRLVVERLERKTQAIEHSLKQNKNNWEESFYHFLARSFGVQQNSEPFEALAKSLPLKILSKHKQSLRDLEALLLGQAGFLEGLLEESYPKTLQKEYIYLQQKYHLIALQESSWKFGRMRPPNFPTIRLAQFAVLVKQSNHLFSKILAEKNIQQLKAMFEVQLSDYWLTHYRLGEISNSRKKSLGKGTIDLILINTVAPFLFVYGKHKGEEEYQSRAIRLLEEIKSEKNGIIDNWSELGLASKSAYDSQALLQLKQSYCEPKRCLDCPMGHLILKGN